MESHPPNSRPAPRRRLSAEPIDSAWLEARAIRYVARWEATRQGVRQLLERKVLERGDLDSAQTSSALALIPDIVEGLAKKGYVEDRRFAEMSVERLRRQGRSRAQIEAYLLRKGIPESLAGEVVGGEAPEQDLDAAWRLARLRRLGPYCLDAERRAARREKQLAFLARRGFSLETALGVIDARTPPDQT